MPKHDGLTTYSIRNRIIEYPAYEIALNRIEKLHQRAKQTGHPGGLLITGLSGSGKSTVKQEYRERYPVRDMGEVSHIRVLTVDTPAGPTVKNLAEAILVALEDPLGYRGTTEQKTQRIYHFLKICKVELIIIDEFQHFIQHGGRSQTLLVSDWLKNLINKAAVPVVLIGLPECEHVLKLNVQLARRFSARHKLKSFGFYSEDEQREFRAVLSAVADSLPVRTVRLDEPKMAQRMFFATYGLIDFVCKITDAAFQIALEEGATYLDERIYAAAFEEEVWRDAPVSLNPFRHAAKLRPLIRQGEPFHEWAQEENPPSLSL